MTRLLVPTCVVSAVVALCAQGCGLTIRGTNAEPPIDDSGSSAPPGSTPVTGDASVVATCAGLPSTWGLVALVAGDAACPDGYTLGQTDLRAGPTPRPDACACSCAVEAMPACTRTAGASYDTNGSKSCGLASSSAWGAVASGACRMDMWPGPWTLVHDWKWSAPTRSGGSCSASSTKHVNRIDFAQAKRACVPNAGCEGAPPIAAPGRRCVLSEGDVACPSNGSFTDRVAMAKAYDVTCDAAACTCAVSGTCTGAQMTFFSGGNCTGASFTMAADGTCVTSTGTGNVASYRYAATLTGGGCQPAGTAAVAATIAALPMTLCCAP